MALAMQRPQPAAPSSDSGALQNQPAVTGGPTAPVWHGYLMSADEHRQLKRLLASALLDDALCARLVHQRDAALMAEFGLSEASQRWLSSLQADTLADFAREIALSIA